MKHGEISKIANLTGLNYSTIWNYCRRPPKRMPFKAAEALERATGVDKLIWLRGNSEEICEALERLKHNLST